MNITEDITKLFDELKHQRDEIQLQLHLANMEVKEEWEKVELKWPEFERQLQEMADDTKETSQEIIHASKIIGDEISTAYKRINERLSK